jgi:N-acetyl-anhydromuramoyl-L-alanine amidase
MRLIVAESSPREAGSGPRAPAMPTATHSPLRIDTATGLLAGARQVLTPNFDSRPPGVQAELLVVHGISLPPGEFGGPWIDRLFTGALPPEAHPYFKVIEGLRASAHVLIRRDGELVQYVPFGERAWHAGKSEYRGRSACNDFSIGVELEGTDHTPYTEPQYQALASLAAALFATYPSLSPERIAGHSDIAPGRKSDPGPSFDWKRLRALIRERMAAA